VCKIAAIKKLVLEAFKEAHPEIEEQNTLVHNFAVSFLFLEKMLK
jgi:hypothetical protein